MDLQRNVGTKEHPVLHYFDYYRTTVVPYVERKKSICVSVVRDNVGKGEMGTYMQANIWENKGICNKDQSPQNKGKQW